MRKRWGRLAMIVVWLMWSGCVPTGRGLNLYVTLKTQRGGAAPERADVLVTCVDRKGGRQEQAARGVQGGRSMLYVRTSWIETEEDRATLTRNNAYFFSSCVLTVERPEQPAFHKAYSGEDLDILPQSTHPSGQIIDMVVELP